MVGVKTAVFNRFLFGVTLEQITEKEKEDLWGSSINTVNFLQMTFWWGLLFYTLSSNDYVKYSKQNKPEFYMVFYPKFFIFVMKKCSYIL